MAASRKHLNSAITGKADEGQCKAASEAPQLGLITDHHPALSQNFLLSPSHRSSLLAMAVQSPGSDTEAPQSAVQLP